MKKGSSLLLASVLLLAALAGCSTGEDSSLVSKTPFPEFSEADTEGNPVSSDIFADYDATIVNFWNNGCGTCIEEMPELVEKTLGTQAECQYIASKLVNADSLLYIGRGLDYALSMEGSLKLKEISYIHSESYAAGELKHGTISLITQAMNVIAVATQDNLFDKTISNVKEAKARGAKVTLVCKEGIEMTGDVADYIVHVPAAADDILMPLVTVVPLQLIAYYTSVLRGCDVDKPRNLAKSVTVE